MREFESIRDFFTSASLTALIDLPFIFIFIAIIAMIGGVLAFVPLAAIPLVVIVGLMLQKSLAKVVKESLNESALKNALLFETFTGLETIKTQAAEGHTQRNWEELNDKASRTSVKIRHISSFAMNWSAFVQQLVSVLIVVVGVYLISSGYLSMGGLIACVLLSARALAPLSTIAGLLTRLSQTRESLHHLNELMKKPVERPKGKHFVPCPMFKAAWNSATSFLAILGRAQKPSITSASQSNPVTAWASSARSVRVKRRWSVCCSIFTNQTVAPFKSMERTCAR